jgi:cAMP phosphodiesterase
VKIELVGSSIGAGSTFQNMTTYIINDSVAIDAGSLGLVAPLSRQLAIQHVLLSHSHLDHVATLPIFLDNVFGPDRECPKVYASRNVWDCLSRDVFNDRLWADLSGIASEEGQFYTPIELQSESTFQIAGLSITPVSVDHSVPTLGFLVEDDRIAILIVSDTGPTERIWELARQQLFYTKLKAVFLECSFSNSFEWLAKKTAHLCPRLFAAEFAKLPLNLSIVPIAVHLKGWLCETIEAELAQLSLPGLCFGDSVKTWDL